MSTLKNRYEFMFYIQCLNGNPNGDPDMGNSPRIDPETMHGYITDVAIKRRIRNYVCGAHGDEPGKGIIYRLGTNINRFIAEAGEEAGAAGKTLKDVEAKRRLCCEKYFDVRAFGAVLSTGPNAGQVRGPVQLEFARSIDPINTQDISITRMCVAKDLQESASSDDYLKWEQEQDAEKLRTMGRKQFIPFGLYEARGFVSANLAAETGFDEDDLDLLFEAILNMYEHDRSASKGEMSVVSPVIVFRHVGTDSDECQRARQAKLGCAPAFRLFDSVSVKLREGVETARSYADYDAYIDLGAIPAGVEVCFKTEPFGELCVGRIPEGEKWLKDGQGR